MRGVFLRISLLLLAVSVTRSQPVALSVNPASREEVRQFYRTIFPASENVPMNWSGSYESGTAGETSAAFKEATRLRVNFYRALVGVPADITFNSTYSAQAQQAALLMSVNDSLSHTPPPSWRLYTPIAATAAGNSNLALGHAGPDAISGYVSDAGGNNVVVGHRRWLFYPQTLQMGTGDVPGVPLTPTLRAANALWVVDTTPGGQFGAQRPVTRTTDIPYPPRGFVPYQLVWPRWSFSYPGADFSASTVTMTRNGQSVAATLEGLGNNVGEPTLVWVYDNRDPNNEAPHERPSIDTTYSVFVRNVRIAGASQDFSYNVTVFDPERAGADFVPVAIAGPPFPAAGKPNTYTVTKPTFASAFDWRTVQLTPVARTFTAEAGLEGLLASTSAGYDVVQTALVGSGTRSYRLAHVPARADEILRVPGTYLVNSSDSALTFSSRLAIATATETARVQISTDDGTTWSDVFSQSGTSPLGTGFPPSTESAFVPRTIALGAYSGRSVNVRLVYSIGFGGAFIPDPTNNVGWFIDDLTLRDVQAITAEPPVRVANGTVVTFSPASLGVVGLQARGVMFGAYPMEWGPIAPVNVVSGDPTAATSTLSNLSVRTGAGTGAQTLIVGFAISGGTKPLLVRGIGPSLTSFGVSGVLNDPKLELFDSGGKIQENDNWLAGDATTFDRLGAFQLASGSRDAALVVSLAPNSYTAQVSGANGGTGIALVELYDAGTSTAGAKLANVSARSEVGTGNNILIAGFSISGTGSKTLLIRAVGPALSGFGVTGALTDPKLELFGPNGKIQENDNWDVQARSMFTRTGAFDLPTASRDAVLVVTLPPGPYTAQVSGVGSATGVALVEVYDVP
jgi:hypothetical protein